MSRRILQVMIGGVIPININGINEVEILELLGSGAFGSVWKVKDCVTGKLYILKLLQGIKPGTVMVERVRLEAEVSVPSEYIVPVLGLCEWDDSTFLILFEYFPGNSLDKLLLEGKLTSQQKKDIFYQTLLGVADAHHHNIIHRDLKPDNIVVGSDGQVKLIDFGISKFKGTGLTVSGEIIGTIPYMPPELLLYGSKFADARADIYALGHILYELAMGIHFWGRKGWRELKDFARYLKQTPKPVDAIDFSDFHCDFFSEAYKVLPRMVKVDYSLRYRSVDEVLTDLGYIPGIPEIPKDLHLRYPLLIVESGSNKSARSLVNIEDGKSLILGRSDIAGDDSSISRSHIEIKRVGNVYFLRDLNSRNGTLVRGIALEEEELIEIKHGDRLKIGDVFLRFLLL